MSTTAQADGRVESRVANYAGFFEKDSSKDSQAHMDNRLENYTDVINGYYDGATELYEYGWAQSFHFSRFYKGEGFLQSLARHEHYLAAQMNLKPGMKVLDVGCGIGGPAREIARFSDAHITGVNNNDFQIGRARKYTAKAGLSDTVNFVKGDFTKLSEQFGENTYDAVYAIEATVHAPTFESVYGQIFSVLKPGGVFGVYEWVMTDQYDASNPEHRRVAHGIEIGDGIPEMRTHADSRKALKAVGFQIEHEEDLADRNDYVPWYYPLEGDFSKAQTIGDYATVFRTTKFGMWTTSTMVWCLEKIGVVPKGTWAVGETMKQAASALVEGGQKKIRYQASHMSSVAQEPQILARKDLPINQAKWVTLKVIEWKDQDGIARRWEVAERTTRKGEIDAVAILAVLHSKKKDFKPSTIIIEQYRPPIEKYVVELPAGLVDAGESPETAAVRELEEETGYKADSIMETSPVLVSDPGMTNANMKFIALDVTLNEDAPDPKQKLEAGEHIVKRVVELDGLNDELKAYSKRGFAIDARLAHFAIGWDMARKLIDTKSSSN
ncbi:Delta(24)-sterol C-methyltransferase [Tulasnella sp. 330]|nr:Delta(24)-sterol C-methyltransferase [Tulasnella sp. 330]